ncbi:hypothetical protein FACS189435_2230 [Bacteroidia bacterium]|nr:hypothetical protein FACS189435_2230 [Bacteroidia bacterium]
MPAIFVPNDISLERNVDFIEEVTIFAIKQYDQQFIHQQVGTAQTKASGHPVYQSSPSRHELLYV